MQRQVFVTGGTGYIGRILIERLTARGHGVRALVRAGSEGRLPSGAVPVVGDALSAPSYATHVAPADTLVQLVGTPHPSPRKAAEFERVDRPSGMAAVAAALAAGVKHLVYVSVAHPAPIMHAYIAARVAVEARIHEAHAAAGLNATILRPWYVLGPGHRWAHILSPLYALGRLVPSMRAGAERLGLVTREEMLAALVQAVENPADGVRVLDVSAIRRARGTLRTAVSLFWLIATLAVGAHAQAVIGPDTVVVRSGTLTLRALLWRPGGRGPYPAVLFNHGNGATMEPEKPATLGPIFARRGYVFLFLYRRGSGLSAAQGVTPQVLMEKAFASGGAKARDTMQIRLLEGDHLLDALAGLAALRAMPAVDGQRVVLAGHSFGGALVLLLAARDSAIRATLDFAGAARSWDPSALLRARLIAAVDRSVAPIFFIQAANDYSIAPSRTLAAEMERVGKRHRIRIYRAFGRNADQGHDFVYGNTRAWEPDVFAFLDAALGR